jgi:hypothetical protein
MDPAEEVRKEALHLSFDLQAHRVETFSWQRSAKGYIGGRWGLEPPTFAL